MKVFYDKGYKSATTRELARACGMSEGALYRYIGSKSDILHLLCLYASSAREILEDYRSSLGNVSITEILSKCIERYFIMQDESADALIFIGREIHNFSHEDRKILLGIQVDVIQFFEGILREGIEQGVFQIEYPELVAHDILMRGQDYALRRWYLKKKYSLNTFTRNFIDLLLKGIRADRISSGM
jgi:AcrR family transcriptional regulator